MLIMTTAILNSTTSVKIKSIVGGPAEMSFFDLFSDRIYTNDDEANETLLSILQL